MLTPTLLPYMHTHFHRPSHTHIPPPHTFHTCSLLTCSSPIHSSWHSHSSTLRISAPHPPQEDSPICLVVGVPLITCIAVVTLLGTPITVLIVLHFRMSIHQRKTRQQQMMQSRPNTYTQMSTLFDEITSSTASGVPLLSPRSISQKVEVGEMIANGRLGQVFVGCYQGETVAVKKFHLGCEQVWFRAGLISITCLSTLPNASLCWFLVSGTGWLTLLL